MSVNFDPGKVIRIEEELDELARNATERKTRRAKQRNVRKLFEIATIHFDEIAPHEKLDSPAEIARAHLNDVATERHLKEFDPVRDTVYLEKLKIRQQNLPVAEAILDRVIAEAS